jgi:hypothetical protein
MVEVVELAVAEYDFIDSNLNKDILDEIDIGYVPFILHARQFTADPTPISNICFPKNTVVTTDQGTLFIENMVPNHHTIDTKRIVAVTKTVSMDKYLVCFEKDAIGLNYPSRTTTMSKDHKLLYKGKWIESYKFLGKFRNVHVTEYSGEILYNVLMDEHYAMNVNGLMCETLHPDNVISQLHKCRLGKEYKNNLITTMNACMLKNDYASYKMMAQHLLY